MFQRLFNCMRSSEDDLNEAGVPDNYTPLVLQTKPDTQESFLPRGVIKSSSVDVKEMGSGMLLPLTYI